MERVYWTDRSSFPIEKTLELFFQNVMSRGYRPYRDGDFSLAFGVCNGLNRQVDFLHRGYGRIGYRDPLLEVILVDADKYLRLGPFFGLRESTCVVVIGYNGARNVCHNWLDGKSVETVLASAEFLDRSDLSELRAEG